MELRKYSIYPGESLLQDRKRKLHLGLPPESLKIESLMGNSVPSILAVPQLTVRLFDWDNTVLHMPSAAMLVRSGYEEVPKVSSAMQDWVFRTDRRFGHLPKSVSELISQDILCGPITTNEFAQVRNKLGTGEQGWGEYGVYLNSPEQGTELNRDFFREETAVALEDVDFAAPAYQIYQRSLDNPASAQTTGVLTSRDQSSKQIYAAHELLVQQGRMRYMPKQELVFPINSPAMQNVFGASLTSPDEAKSTTVSILLDWLQKQPIQDNAKMITRTEGDAIKQPLHLFEFWEDDPEVVRNFIHGMSARMKEDSLRWSKVKLIVHYVGDTSEDLLPSTVVTSSNGRACSEEELAEIDQVLNNNATVVQSEVLTRAQTNIAKLRPRMFNPRFSDLHYLTQADLSWLKQRAESLTSFEQEWIALNGQALGLQRTIFDASTHSTTKRTTLHDVVSDDPETLISHATHSSAWSGLADVGAVLPSVEMQALGIPRKTGERGQFSGTIFDTTSVGRGAKGIGMVLAYADLYRMHPRYNLALLSEDELGKQHDMLRTLLDTKVWYVNDYGEHPELNTDNPSREKWSYSFDAMAQIGEEIDWGSMHEHDNWINLSGHMLRAQNWRNLLETEMVRRKEIMTGKQQQNYPILFLADGNGMKPVSYADCIIPEHAEVQRISFERLRRVFVPEEHLSDAENYLTQGLAVSVAPRSAQELLSPLETLEAIVQDQPDLMDVRHLTHRNIAELDRITCNWYQILQRVLPAKPSGLILP